MKILWFTWKDMTHPEAGGAEYMNETIAQELVKRGHDIIFLVAGYPGAAKKETVKGYTVIRLGNRYTVYFLAYLYYKRHLRGWADKVIEEINTVPFMTQWYVAESRNLLIYQLCREIWFYQTNLLVALIGFLLEPIYLFLLRNNVVLTESESTRTDLVKHGFKKNNIRVIPVINAHLQALPSIDKDTGNFYLLSFGAIRPMKRTLDQIRAFEIARKSIPQLKLIVAGLAVGSYGGKVMTAIRESSFSKDISILGRVSDKQREELMRKAHVILVTSVKEGWGLIVTEAGAYGTPAVVYDTDGLRDSVEDGTTGFVTIANSEALARKIVELYNAPTLYQAFQLASVKKSNRYTVENSVNAFLLNIQGTINY